MATIIRDINQFNNRCNTADELAQLVVSQIAKYYPTAKCSDKINSFFSDMEHEYIFEDNVQNFQISGIHQEKQGLPDYIPLFSVNIYGHYIDPGSEDYIYSVDVYEL